MKISTACGPALLMILTFSVNEIAAQEGPGIVIAYPGQDVELLCAVTGGVPTWRVNNVAYTQSNLFTGQLARHNITGSNIIVENIMMNDNRNGSVYICVIPQTPPTPDIESDPTTLYVAGVPAMVPNVTSDIYINGDIVTLTLKWGEPFNNLDPIVNYTVSYPVDVIVSYPIDVTCTLNFTITDNTTRSFTNTTRSYTITNLTPMTSYTFSVVATNSIGSGEAGVEMITTPPAIDQVTGVTLTCRPVCLSNQCNVIWNPIAQGDITEYQVYYNGTMRNVNSSTTTLTFTAPPLPDDVFTGTVVAYVTAISRFGIGLVSSSESAEIHSASVTNITNISVSYINAQNVYNIAVNCTIHPDSTADQCVVMAMTGGRVIGEGTGPVIDRMATVTDRMATVTVIVNESLSGVYYTITAGGTFNKSLVGPKSSFPFVGIDINLSSSADESDDEPSMRTVVPISIVVTFIITLVVTALISVIITSLYYKHRYELKKKVKVDGDKNVNTK